MKIGIISVSKQDGGSSPMSEGFIPDHVFWTTEMLAVARAIHNKHNDPGLRTLRMVIESGGTPCYNPNKRTCRKRRRLNRVLHFLNQRSTLGGTTLIERHKELCGIARKVIVDERDSRGRFTGKLVIVDPRSEMFRRQTAA